MTSADKARRGPSLRLAADIGGTFTDVAAFDTCSGKLKFGKVPSVPARLADGIDAAVEKAGTAYVVTGIMHKPALAKIARGKAAPPRQAVTGKRPVYSTAGALSRRATSQERRFAPATASPDPRSSRSTHRPRC
jgi:hypothetical protein